MSSINMAGMGTGLDVHGMAKQLALVKVQPRHNQLRRQELVLNEEMAALNKLKSSLEDFYKTLDKSSSAEGFGSLKVKMNSDDEQFLKVKTDKDAVPGSYSVQVDKLATKDKVNVFSQSSTDDKARVPEGKYTIKVDGKNLDIVVPKDSKMSDVMKQINDHPKNPGVSANIVNDGKESHLTLTSKKTGEAQKIEVLDADSKDVIKKRIQKAQDAEFFVDGMKMTNASNTVDNAIHGVTLELNKVTKKGEPIQFDIQADTDTMTKSVKGIVSAYNKVLGTIGELTKTEPGGKGESAKRAALANDPMTKAIARELKAVTSSEFGGTFKSLASIGVTRTREGDLQVSDKKLKDALKKDSRAVAELFTGDKGLIKKWQKVTNNYTGRVKSEDKEKDDNNKVRKEGQIDERMKKLKTQLSKLEDSFTELETRFKTTNDRYLKRFIAMDLAVAKMNMSMARLV